MSTDYSALIDAYVRGPDLLRQAVDGMTAEQLDAVPIPGKWSTRQVVAHVTDFEPIYADRMKRVIAEFEPPLRGGDPDVFAAQLAYATRDVEAELELTSAVRRHVATILRTLSHADFQRTGIHNEAGPLSLEKLLVSITQHIPHHIRFIEEKRHALQTHSR